MSESLAVATSDVIMLDLLIYLVGSIFIIVALDWYAAKKIGDRRRPAYQALKVHKALAYLIVGAVTLVVGVLCMYKDLTISRYALTYLGLPYFLALVYYMTKVLRRVKSESRRHRF